MRSKFKWIFTLLVAFTMQFSFAQEKTVTGVVNDGKTTLPGANVLVKGTKNGVSTDFDGKFAIKAKAGDVLLVSFTGYDTQSITVGAANSYTVKLKETAKLLDEVMITGAVGIKRKSDAVTSTVQKVTAKELSQAANPNILQALNGKVSGLQISNTGSGVNSSSKILLRGYKTITGDSQALIVIDNAISSTTILNQISPDMIADLTILKGAQGAALYGDQGSNGVIVVTTKKGGSSGKALITFNSSVDMSNVAYVPDMQTSYGQGWTPSTGEVFGTHPSFTPVENGSWGPAFNDPAYSGQVLPVGIPLADGSFRMQEYKYKKDNIKKFFKTGAVYQFGGSVNLGDEDGYASITYNRLSNDFIVQDDKNTKNSFILKAGKKLGKFNIDGGVTYINSLTAQTDKDIYDDLLQTPTSIDVEDFSSGSYFDHWTVWRKSPYWTVKNVRFNDNDNTYVGNLTLGYKLNKHISTRITANANLYDNMHKYHNNGMDLSYVVNMQSPYTLNGSSTFDFASDWAGVSSFNSSYYRQNYKSTVYYGDWLVNFDYDLTKDINFKTNLGLNIQDSSSSTQTSGGYGISKPGIYNENNLDFQNEIYFSTASTLNYGNTPDEFYSGSNLSNGTSRKRKVAQFANVDLSYKDYLFLNLTARHEKSSTIKSDQFYPSAGVSFVPTKLFPSLGSGKMNYLKVYGNYVVTGNSSNVGAYETYGVYSALGAGFPYGTSPVSYTVSTSQINPDIRPEIVTTYEAGFNASFFNDRITLGTAVYQADTKDLVNYTALSRTSGYNNWKGNIGALRNKGMEIDLSLVPVKYKDFKWTLKTSFTTFDTKVLSLADGASSLATLSYPGVGIGTYAVVGESFPTLQGTGFKRDANGNVIVDANGVPLNTGSGIINLGKVTADYIMGFTNTFEYKGVKLTAVVDYRQGGKFYSFAKSRMSFTGTDTWLDYDRDAGYVWPNSVTASGATNTTPIAYDDMVSYVANGSFGDTAEAFVVDATAIRVRELSLGYALPSKVTSAIGVKTMNFSVNARNPFVWFAKSNHNYGDPESSYDNGNTQGISPIDRYPTVKTLGFTLNVTF